MYVVAGACTQVIVMESTWRSDHDREALLYLRPNPYYVGLVRMLLAQIPVRHGLFLILLR